MGIYSHETQYIHPDFLRLWSTYQSTVTLFPRLTAVQWCSVGIRDEQLPVFLSSIGPHLKAIRLGEWSLAPEEPLRILQTALATIALRCPLLENIEVPIPSHEDSSLLSSELLLLSQRATRLTAFECPYIPITVDVFASLGRLSNLTSMAITLSSPSTWHLADDAFPVLRNLRIVATTRSYIAFSTLTRLPVVDALDLRLSDAPNADELDALILSICRQFSSASLQTLTIVPTDEAVELDPDATILPHHLRPLLSYKQLSFLDISFVCHYSLDHPFYEDLAQALPGLTALAIGDGAGCVHVGRPSLDVLVPFALHCVNLIGLSISLDATHRFLPQAVVLALPPTAHISGVSYLNVGISPIDHPEAVAAFIARVFPNVAHQGIQQSDWLWTPQVRAWAKSWEKVDLLLPWIAAVGEAGRQRRD